MSKYVDINNGEEFDEPVKKKHTSLIIILILVLVIIGLLAVILFVFKFNILQFAKELFDSREAASAVSMEYTEYEMGIGQEMAIEVNLTPKKTKTSYTLSSSDESIVSVDKEDMTLKALKTGSCIITATTSNLLEATARVDVLLAPTSLKITSEDVLFMNDALRLSTATADGESRGAVVYTCSDEARAKVSSDGIVTPILPGEVKVTATTYNGISDSKKIRICKPVSKISLSQSKLILTEGSSVELSYTLEKDEYSKTIEFTSDNEPVASVDDKGKITANKKGNALIKVRADNNVTSSCEVVVADNSPVIRKNLDKTKPMVALTFDDGPSADNTKSILTTLDKYKAKATFFIVGNRVDSNSDLIKTMYDSGHEIGNHSWDHSYAEDLGEQEQISEIVKTDEAIYSVTGAIPSVFRCPGGIETDVIRENVGVPIISWSVDTNDWETKSAKATYERITGVFERGLNLDGDIILMHDIQDSTPAAVKNICAYLNKRGYQMVTVSELAYYQGIEMQAGETYSCFYPEEPRTELPVEETKAAETKKNNKTKTEKETTEE